MIWYILASVIFALGAWGYFNSKKQIVSAHADINDEEEIRQNHLNHHESENGHSCCS